jgi:membrane-associated phospholipid phosphatase
MFATFLPVVNPNSLDLELYQLDLTLFGFEPALYMDRLVGPITTEWFAFFYFSYFMILAAHLFPILFFGKDKKLVAEFCLGLLLMLCLGHTGYMLVPGFGPHQAIAQEFHNQLPSGMWLDAVMTTVASGGAQKDIFPSLHTAAPTFLALFSLRHRDRLPFRYTWPIVAFFAVNIIFATMYLRWHYVIDVIAGLFLATGSLLGTVALQRREFPRRAALGLMPSWPVFFADGPRKSR